MISDNSFTTNVLTTFQSSLGSVDRSVANINGFTNWTWIPIVSSQASGTKKSISSNEVPGNLIPTREFQIAAETATCSVTLPWGGFADPFSEFFLSGGTTGTLFGAISGLNVVEQSFLQKSVANYGFGEEYTGPEIGYCLGTLFKEKLYSKIFAENIFNIDSIEFCDEQILFRSSFERFYLSRGLIKSFEKKSESIYEIRIETKSQMTAIQDSSSVSDTITLYSRDDGSSKIFKINNVKGENEGGDIIMEISPSEELNEVFSPRDFFALSNPWLVQDPYLIDGKLESIRDQSLPSGTYEFFSTDQNEFVFRGYVTGIYIRRRNIFEFTRVLVPSSGEGLVVNSDGDTEDGQYIVKFVDVKLDNGDELIDRIPVSDVYLVESDVVKKYPGNPIDMPGYDEDIEPSNQYYWSFIPTDKWEESDTYKGKNRTINRILENDFGETEYSNIELLEGSESDYIEYYDDFPEYFKIELSLSASSRRTNLYDNSLVGNFYVQNNKYFEIIGQEGVNIIDVASLDITRTAFLDPYLNVDYILLQEFGWKFKEWEMFSPNQPLASDRSTSRSFFLNGEITSIDKKKRNMKVKVYGENSATTSEQSYYKSGERSSISFYERFIDEYKHTSGPLKFYKKYKGWHIYSTTSSQNGVNSYRVNNIEVDEEKVLFFDSGDYNISITFDEEPENFSQGDAVYCIFDPSPYKRQGAFRGTQIINTEQIPETRFGEKSRLCLDGFWLSPRYELPIPEGTRLGLCGGRYWGLADAAFDNNYAIVFMRSPRTGLGISSIINQVSNINYVLFYDYFTRKLSLRMGTLKYSEYPRKYFVTVGFPDSSEIVNLNKISPNDVEIPLDSSKYATKTISFLSDEYPSNDNVIIFSVKEAGEYYGTTVSGEGKMKLIGFDRYKKAQDKDVYKYKGEPVSPCYEYGIGQYSFHKSRDIYVSVETSDSPIVVSSDTSLSSLNKAIVNYADLNQHIFDSNFIDIIKTDYDEFLLFMGRQFTPFTVEGSEVINNSSIGSKRWSFQEGVFAIGSRDLGGSWGTPGKNISEDNQYGILFLDSAKYLCSIYHNVSNNILIFFASTIGEQVYLGCLIVNNSNINYKLLKCKAEGDYRDFYWRPPLVPNNVYKPNISYGIDIEEDIEEDIKDDFIFIASESLKDAQVKAKDVTDFGTVSCSQLKDGRIIVLYDSLDGINLIFSNSSGFSWLKSEVILVRNASSSLYIEPFLFFITSSGMFFKIISSNLISKCAEAIEGKTPNFIEQIQSEVDEEGEFDLQTGEIPDQKISGFYNDSGLIQIFYYNSDGKLSSIVGSGSTWEKAQNF